MEVEEQAYACSFYFRKAGVLFLNSCEHVFLDIMIHNTTGGVNIINSKYINGRIMVHGVNGIGIDINGLTESQLSLIAKDCATKGIVINNANDNIFSQITCVNNVIGLTVSEQTTPTARNIFKDCIIYGNSTQNLLINKGTTNTMFRDISFKTDSLDLFLDLAQDASNTFENVKTFS